MAVREGKTTFDEIAASQGRVAATSKALGVQMEEELAVFAASTKAGIAQSEVVSALKAAYSNILKPTKEAQEAATDRMGYSSIIEAARLDGTSIPFSLLERA